MTHGQRFAALGKQAAAVGSITLALVAPCPARADTQTLFQSGPWILYGGTSNSGHALCGMRVTDTNDTRTIHIKYFAGDDHLTIQMFKTSWRVPQGTRLQVVMQMDSNPVWTARAYGEADHIEFTIPYAGLDNFSREFRYSGQMSISFPEGSEQAWLTSLAGTNVMVDRFVGCMHDVRQAQGAPSQPYDGGQTQPSQPYSGTPTQPSQPQQPSGSTGTPAFGGKPQPYHGNQQPQPTPEQAPDTQSGSGSDNRI